MADISNITVSVEGVDTVCEIKDKVARNDIAINRTTLGYQCKNLFDFKNATIGKSSTATGFDVTVGDDGSVTIKGTKPDGAWADIQIILKKRISLKNGEEYILSSENKAANVISTRLVSYKDNVRKFLGLATANNSETNIILEEPGYEVTAYMITISDTNPVDITLYPMLRLADIFDGTYEPYQPSVKEQVPYSISLPSKSTSESYSYNGVPTIICLTPSESVSSGGGLYLINSVGTAVYLIDKTGIVINTDTTNKTFTITNNTASTYDIYISCAYKKE